MEEVFFRPCALTIERSFFPQSKHELNICSLRHGTIKKEIILFPFKKSPYLCSVNHRYHLEIDAAKA